MSIAETPPATTARYLIDAKGSTFTVRAFATGVLSVLGHSPTIAIPDFQGEVQFSSSTLEDASLRLVIQAASSTVTDDISNKDRREMERQMHDDVLEVDSYPEIIYECPRVSSVQKISEGSYSVPLDGELTLRGVTRSQPVAATVTLKGDVLRATGDFSILQSDYEIRPVSAVGGTIKLKDELKLSFIISARRQA
ncbi:MAG: YceI family protein [Candidatus Sulfotelmatobacter sp.]